MFLYYINMKDLKEYISETLNESIFDKDLIAKNVIEDKPKTKIELIRAISKYIEITKPKKGDTINLNWLDVSKIKDLGAVFDGRGREVYSTCNFDVSEWDVSNCENFTGMFQMAKAFNCDLSKWDVSSATHMGWMFQGAKEFKGEGLENWKVPGNCFYTGMFRKSGVTEKNAPSWANKWTFK